MHTHLHNYSVQQRYEHIMINNNNSKAILYNHKYRYSYLIMLTMYAFWSSWLHYWQRKCLASTLTPTVRNYLKSVDTHEAWAEFRCGQLVTQQELTTVPPPLHLLNSFSSFFFCCCKLFSVMSIPLVWLWLYEQSFIFHLHFCLLCE